MQSPTGADPSCACRSQVARTGSPVGHRYPFNDASSTWSPSRVRKLVGIELDGDPVEQPTQHWPAFADGEQVGHVTDACWSPRLEKNIGYVWVPIALAEPGNRLEIHADDGERTGTTATIPFIDPKKKVPAA